MVNFQLIQVMYLLMDSKQIYLYAKYHIAIILNY